MSAKRQATTELTIDNWDKEDIPEEPGTFRCASEEELKNRVIKKARRAVTENAAADAGTSTKGVFSGFSGFGNVGSSTIKALPLFSSTSSDISIANTKAHEAHGSSTYCKKVAGLNQAVSKWIQSCIANKPVCILTPIFKNYEDYLKKFQNEEIDNEKNDETGTETTAAATTTSKTTVSSESPVKTAPVFSFGSGSVFGGNTGNDNKPAVTSIFGGIAGSSSTSTAFAAKPNGFSFATKPTTMATDDDKQKAQNVPSTSGFSFTPGATPFSFGNIKPPAVDATSSNANGEDDDEEDQPPQVDFKQVVEEDVVYSKKCKVFVKKDDNFVDRGVGTVYLKPVQGGEKTQLLVRADTNLGNILVNLILSVGIPAQRMGKNNVMLVCIPTPNEEKATPLLLRVKTSEEADELLETIKKYTK